MMNNITTHDFADCLERFAKLLKSRPAVDADLELKMQYAGINAVADELENILKEGKDEATSYSDNLEP